MKLGFKIQENWFQVFEFYNSEGRVWCKEGCQKHNLKINLKVKDFGLHKDIGKGTCDRIVQIKKQNGGIKQSTSVHEIDSVSPCTDI